MAQALSNFTISLPISSPKNKLMFPNCPYIAGGITKRVSVKAVGGEGRDKGSLDHLQRVSEKQPQRPTRRTTPQTAPIGLWDRFPTARTVQQMMETMDTLINDPLAFNTATWPSQADRYSRGRTPWEIKESERDYRLRFDMPGMTKEDVKVYIEEKMLVVKAEKEDEREREGEWDAKSYGRYSSRIALPENVEFEKIKAEVKDGVLYVTVPKTSGGSKILDINVE